MRAPGSQPGPFTAYDWSSTELGDSASWPTGLRLCVDIVLAAPLPMLLDWSDRHIVVCNAAYAALAASRFVRAPGGKVPAIAPPPLTMAPEAFARARSGEPATAPRQRLAFLRDDGRQVFEHDLHLVPVRGDGGAVEGVLCMLQASAPLPPVDTAPASAPAPAATSAAAAPKPASLRILVVEDNPDSQYLVCEMLKAFGHAPDGTGHAEQALELLARKEYDVLFSDVSLPGMSGVELARLARERQRGLCVIFASGYGEALLRHLDFPYQALLKPYELDELQKALANIVASADSGV